MELAKAIILLRWYKVKVVIVQWYVVGYHISSERVRLVISYRYHMAFLPFSDLHVKATCRLTFTATASSCHIQLDADWYGVRITHPSLSSLGISLLSCSSHVDTMISDKCRRTAEELTISTTSDVTRHESTSVELSYSHAFNLLYIFKYCRHRFGKSRPGNPVVVRDSQAHFKVPFCGEVRWWYLASLCQFRRSPGQRYVSSLRWWFTSRPAPIRPRWCLKTADCNKSVILSRTWENRLIHLWKRSAIFRVSFFIDTIYLYCFYGAFSYIVFYLNMLQ